MRVDKYRHLNQNCPDPTFDLSQVRDVLGRQAAVLNSVRLPTNTEGGLATAISYQSIVCSSRSSPQAWPSVCGCTQQTCDVKDLYSLKSLSFSLSKQFRPFFVNAVPSGMTAHLRLLVRGLVQSQRERNSSWSAANLFQNVGDVVGRQAALLTARAAWRRQSRATATPRTVCSCRC